MVTASEIGRIRRFIAMFYPAYIQLLGRDQYQKPMMLFTENNLRLYWWAMPTLQLGAEAGRLQAELLNAVDRDAESYRQVLGAFRLPKTTAEEKQKRGAAIQAAFRQATEVPLQVAEAALKVLDLAGDAARMGNPDMLTDAGVGVVLARSAALGALMNAKFNLSSLKDRDLVSDLEARIAHLKQDVFLKEAEILEPLDF